MKQRRCKTTGDFLRRLFSLLLVLVMEFTLIPFGTQTAYAADEYGYTHTRVSDVSTLKWVLGLSQKVRIILDGDIDYKENGGYAYWCEVKDHKILDLNGHSITIHNDNTRESTLFKVNSGSTLVILGDPNGSDDDEKITYNAYINSDGDVKYRNLFDVYGTLVVNGGKLEAGRSKKDYISHLAKYLYRQTRGNAVKVQKNGTLIVNGGRLYGRGRWDQDVNVGSAVHAFPYSTVYFNNGIALGLGGGNPFFIYNNANVTVAGGHFEVHHLNRYEDNHAYYSDELQGEMGLTNDKLAYGSTFSPQSGHGNISYFDNLTVYPDPEGGTFTLSVPYGEDYVSYYTGEPYRFVPEDHAYVQASDVKNYFGGLEGLEYCGITHETRYTWTIKDGNTVVATIDDWGDGINMMNLKGGFKPDYNHIYIVSCESLETLKYNGTVISSFKWIGDPVKVGIKFIHGEDIKIDENNFPDQYFRRYVKDKFDENSDGWLNSAERENATELRLNTTGDNNRYINVASLKGIEYLYMMKSIYANGTQLTSFDGSSLPLLIDLDLSETPLESIDISRNSALEYLGLKDLSGDLSYVDLSGNPILGMLETYRSDISVIDISCCPKLVRAALYGEVTERTYSNGTVYALEHKRNSVCYFNNDGNDNNVKVANFYDAFPCAGFRNLIVDNHNFNWDDDMYLTISEAKSIINLDVEGEEENVTSLEGIELLPNLEWLDAGNCRIESADLSKNTKLKTVCLNGNQVLKEINLSGLKQLETLWLNFNSLTEVRLFDLDAITDLDLEANKLTSINLTSQSKLISLDVSENKLTDIDVRNMPNLKTLSAYNNKLSSVDVSRNEALEDLDLSRNKLSDLDIRNCSNLRRFSCFGNNIYLLDISACPDLVQTHREGDYSLVADGYGIQYRYRMRGDWMHSLSWDLTTYVYNGATLDHAVAAIFDGTNETYYYHFSNAAEEAGGRTIILLGDAEEYEMSVAEMLKVKLNGYNLPLTGPEGYAVKETKGSDGVSTFTVVKADAAIERTYEDTVKTIYYLTFVDAAGDYQEGDVIKLLANAGTYSMFEGQTLQIKKNGYSITLTVPEGYVLVTEGPTSGVTTYTAAKAVASVGSTYYLTFEEAAAAANGSVITLYDDAGSYEMSVGETLKVKKNGYSLTVEAPENCIVSETTDSAGVTTYTAEEIICAVYNGASLSLKDKISINIYLIIPEEAKGWKVNVYYEKDNTDSEQYKTARYTYDLRKDGGYYSGFYSTKNDEYKIMFPDVAAKELTEKVRIQIVDSEGQTVLIKRDTVYVDHVDRCAADWANDVIGKPDSEAVSVALAKALLNFGGEAQTYFDYRTDNSANPYDYLATEMEAVTVNDLKDFAGVTDANAAAVGLEESPLSLSLKSETYLNIYFYNSVTATAENLDKAVMKVSKSGSEWVAKITGITAKNLGRQYTLTVKGNGKTSELKYSAMSWAYSVLEKGTNAKAMELAKALYLYQQAAAEYFKQ